MYTDQIQTRHKKQNTQDDGTTSADNLSKTTARDNRNVYTREKQNMIEYEIMT